MWVNVFVVPSIEQTLAVTFALGLQQHPTVVFQAALGGFKKGCHMGLAQLLKRSYADDTVELGFTVGIELRIVTELELHWQMTSKRFSQLDLVRDIGQTQHSHAVMLGGIAHEAAPATTHVEHPHAWAQLQLAANHL